MNDERELYGFTWPGKKEAVLEAGRPTDKVLRPCIEESENFGATENLYIEGDNLEAMKILQRSYMRKVKMIYIDPPYNTGHDFIYSDDFAHDEEEAKEEYGLFDDEGTRNFTVKNYRENTRANPRYHSDWCSMIYPRLRLASNLLRDDGVIFISIDDNEAPRLRMMCDEIFGESNFIANLVWDLGTGTTAGHFARGHEYILVYAKDKSAVSNFINPEHGQIIAHRALKRISSKNPASNIIFPAGFEFEGNNAVFRGEIGEAEKIYILSDEMRFENGRLTAPTTLRAGFAMRNQVLDYIAGREVYDTKGQRVRRFFFNTRGVLFYEKDKTVINPKTVLSGIANTKNGTTELAELLGGNYFSFPKPSLLIRYLVQLATDSDSIILDFFAGSSTTAHAVMSLNASDSGRRKFIMIQLPEICPPSSEAAKAGYSTIADIGRERIRRASRKLAQDFPLTAGQTDSGFRTLRVDSPNFRDVFISPDDLDSLGLDMLADNLKPDRSPLDLLFMCITDSGLPLSLSLDSENFSGFTIYTYGSGEIIACFNECLTEDVITHIAKQKPERAVFRDWGFRDSRTRINLEQLFRYYAPDSEMQIL
ncbi:MAG: site-specific DNA-methyltransferase [Synergistaceae bacterium]|nr:site-specific DNA-methyltransferase [Synergistaceae bacterium]